MLNYQPKETNPVCHNFLSDPTFHRFLFDIDKDIAAEVQSEGCTCGGVLHSARYPRKPRGIRSILDETYYYRLSYCCAEDGCRRRTTPPSVRFLGRKVYLGIVVLLLSAMQHGLSVGRRQALVEKVGVSPQTLWRWRRWWQQTFPASRTWRIEQGRFLPPIEVGQLPGELLGRLSGESLADRVRQLLRLVAPTTTGSWEPAYSRGEAHPQKM
jgi:hypothetical protein